jgi:hypothetical protein
MVQVLATIGSVRPTWLYMGPYGYINETFLVGVGACNNPFFDSNGTPPVIGINMLDEQDLLITCLMGL